MISPRAVIRSARIPALPRPKGIRSSRLAAWRRLEPLHLLWLAIWAPWWVGNELPPPPSPRARGVDMVDLPDGRPGGWILDALDDLRFRFGLSWAAALAIRGAWLGGIAGIAWAVLAMVTSLPSPTLTQLGIAIGIGAALGLVLRVFHRPGYASVAMVLERSFDLRSRLSTAVMGLRYGETGHPTLHELQLADAANALARSRSLLRPNHWVPIRELFILFIVALTLLLVLVARRPEGEIPAVSSMGVPAFVPVSERLAAAQQQPPPPDVADAATLQEVEDLSRTSNQARQDLQAIGDALESNGLTQRAASSIASENYPAANQQLSDASGAVSQQPASDRNALADQLEKAADQVSRDNPELADAARGAADDVRSGQDTGALDTLGNQIEQTGKSVISQQASGGKLSNAPADQQAGSQSGTDSGSSSAASQQQPSDTGSGQTQASSSGDPGAGMDASGGVASQDAPSDQSSSGGTGQDSGTSSGGSDGAAGQQPQDSSASSGGNDQSSASNSTTNGSSSDGGSVNGSPNEEGASAQGSGAGSGETNANDPTNENADGGGSGGDLNNQTQTPDAGSGKAGDPPPGGSGSQGDKQDTQVASGGASVSLPGTSSERVPSGSDIGSSSVGSGGGVGAASGDSTSSVSGSSGPDPNAVPAKWRSIVEDYFRDGGTP